MLFPWVLEDAEAVQGAVLWRLQRSLQHVWWQQLCPEGNYLWMLTSKEAVVYGVPEGFTERAFIGHIIAYISEFLLGPPTLDHEGLEDSLKPGG